MIRKAGEEDLPLLLLFSGPGIPADLPGHLSGWLSGRGPAFPMKGIYDDPGIR